MLLDACSVSSYMFSGGGRGGAWRATDAADVGMAASTDSVGAIGSFFGMYLFLVFSFPVLVDLFLCVLARLMWVIR